MAENPVVIFVLKRIGWVGERSLSGLVYSNGWKLIWIIISAWSIWGCAEVIPHQPLSETDNQILTEADQGRTVELRVGESFQVVLSGNPTTGYTWGLQNFDGKTIRLTGEPVHIADSPMIGANGKNDIQISGSKSWNCFSGSGLSSVL